MKPSMNAKGTLTALTTLAAALSMFATQAANAAQGTEILINASQIPAEYQREGTDENGNPVTLVALPVEFNATGIPGDYQATVMGEQSASMGSFGLDSVGMVPTLPTIHLSTGQLLSMQFGVILGTVTCPGNTWLSCGITGVILEAEPGLGGMKVSAGLGTEGFFAADAKMSALYQWSPLGVGTMGNTYVGPEFSMRVLVIDFSLGFLKNTAGNDTLINFGAGSIYF